MFVKIENGYLNINHIVAVYYRDALTHIKSVDDTTSITDISVEDVMKAIKEAKS